MSSSLSVVPCASPTRIAYSTFSQQVWGQRCFGLLPSGTGLEPEAWEDRNDLLLVAASSPRRTSHKQDVPD